MFKKITLERIPGMVPSPGYKAVIKSDGFVQYTGHQYVRTIGKLQWQISEAAVNEINGFIQKYNYLNIRGKTPEQIRTCGAFCITSVLMQDGRKRRIEHYYGEGRYPKALDHFEDAIEKAIDIEKIIQILA